MTRRTVNTSRSDGFQRRGLHNERDARSYGYRVGNDSTPKRASSRPANAQDRHNVSRESSVSSKRKQLSNAPKRQKREPYLSTKGRQDGYPQSFAPSPYTDESKRRRKRKNLFSFFRGWFLKFLVVFALLLGIAAFIIYYPGFYITSFVIEGSEHVSSAEIMDGVDKAIGEHFIFGIGGSTAHWFGLRYGAMEKRIAERNPMLREVRVAFRFPSQVVIDVFEKTEVIALRLTDGYALLDRNFDVIRVISSPQFDLPILEGVRLLEAAEPGKPIAVEEPEELNSVLSITAAMIRQDDLDQTGGILLMDAVRKIRHDDKDAYYLFIPLEQGGEIRVKIKDNRLLQQKLALLAQLINTWQLKERGTGELDMTGERSVFKPDSAY
ncbi:MAG: cell division protein FtsQ/DivIB [Saccharofermentanales bacterium]|jgi:cell division septal protein FtsQ